MQFDVFTDNLLESKPLALSDSPMRGWDGWVSSVSVLFSQDTGGNTWARGPGEKGVVGILMPRNRYLGEQRQVTASPGK